MERRIVRRSEVQQTPRLKQMRGLFDVAPADGAAIEWDVDLQLPAEWQVGVIIGESGSGKTTIAGELAAELGGRMVGGKDEQGREVPPWVWPADRSILDGFPAGLGIKDVTGLLSSVGFSSPPAWVRPFRVLSNGQQFRVNLARTLAEAGAGQIPFVDEFGSFVHQQVRQVAAAAVAKAVRRQGGKFVAVTCHADCVDYFEPDWVVEISAGQPVRAKHVRGLVRRPSIELDVWRVDRSAWQVFKPHHYLSADLHPGSKCFVGFVGEQPAAFTAVLSFPHPSKPAWREHRTVCLPDFQGVGIGNAMSEFVASLFVSTGKPYISTTSHPAMIRHRLKSKVWRCTRKPGLAGVHSGGNSTGMRATSATSRITAGFDYIGPARAAEARGFGVV